MKSCVAVKTGSSSDDVWNTALLNTDSRHEVGDTRSRRRVYDMGHVGAMLDQSPSPSPSPSPRNPDGNRNRAVVTGGTTGQVISVHARKMDSTKSEEDGNTIKF